MIDGEAPATVFTTGVEPACGAGEGSQQDSCAAHVGLLW